MFSVKILFNTCVDINIDKCIIKLVTMYCVGFFFKYHDTMNDTFTVLAVKYPIEPINWVFNR